MHAKQKNRRIKIGDILLALLCILFLLIIAGCSYNIFYKLFEYKESKDSYTALSEQFVIQTGNAPAEASAGKAYQGKQRPEDTTVPDAVSDNSLFPIEVDFENLLNENDDVVGWLYKPDTYLNYPVVQGEDNKQYLHTLLNGNYNYGGTIFLDSHCAPDFSYRNSILYGHNMTDNTMFRPLLLYKHQEYYDKNPYMYLATPTRNYRISIFACEITKSESDIYSFVFADDDSFEKWFTKVKEQSLISTDIIPTRQSKIITMSTCSYEFSDARTVVLGVLQPYS